MSEAELVRWAVPTRLWIGHGAVEACLSSLATVERACLVVDSEMAGTPVGKAFVRRLRAVLETRCEDLLEEHHPAAKTTADMVLAAGHRWRAAGVRRIAAIGGGSTLDLAALGALPASVHADSAWRRGRAGAVVCPDDVGGELPQRIFVPTTLGTGAEISGAACCERDLAKVLWLGAALRPDEAIHDPAATAGLPEAMVCDAALEILARLLVPVAGPEDRVRPARISSASPALRDPLRGLVDELALANLTALVRLMAGVAARASITDQDRLALAAIGAHSHAGWVHLGRWAFASPVWYVATELSTTLGLRKAAATGLLLPAWSRAVLGGSAVWGDESRLRRAWAAVCAADAAEGGALGICEDPTRGLARLADRWACAGVDRQTGSRIANDVAQACARRWGAGLPMMGSITSEDVACLLRGALRPEAVSEHSGAA